MLFEINNSSVYFSSCLGATNVPDVGLDNGNSRLMKHSSYLQKSEPSREDKKIISWNNFHEGYEQDFVMVV